MPALTLPDLDRLGPDELAVLTADLESLSRYTGELVLLRHSQQNDPDLFFPEIRRRATELCDRLFDDLPSWIQKPLYAK